MTTIKHENHEQGDEMVRTQTITLTLRDIIDAALQAALNDGNGLDGLGKDSKVVLKVALDDGFLTSTFVGGRDFDFETDEDGALKTIPTHTADYGFEAKLVIQNTRTLGNFYGGRA